MWSFAIVMLDHYIFTSSNVSFSSLEYISILSSAVSKGRSVYMLNDPNVKWINFSPI